MVSVGHHRLGYLLLVHVGSIAQLAHRGVTLVLLLEFVDFVINLAQRTYLVQRQSDDTALLGNGLQDGLANPPYGIADELETACLVEFLCGLDQADVTLVNQVGQCQPLVLILFGY